MNKDINKEARTNNRRLAKKVGSVVKSRFVLGRQFSASKSASSPSPKPFNNDTTKEKKSLFRIFIGILFLVISVFWIFDKHIYNQKVNPFDLVYIGVFSLNGIHHLIEGLGYSISKIFKKR
ncbi:MAG: hypothetical protein ACK4K0_08600 [Flavobacteriales bacterium]